MISIPPFWAWNCLSHSIIYPLLVEIVDKTALPNSISKSIMFFWDPFSFLFINFICEIKNTNRFEHLLLNVWKDLSKITLTFILQSVSLLLEMSWIDCYIVRRILQNLTGIDIFINFPGLLLWVHVEIHFNIFTNFERIFFQAALVGCSLKERIINR